MGGGSTKQCGALFCLTQTCLRICRLLYPIRKDKTAKAKTFVASGRQLHSAQRQKIYHKNFKILTVYD
jgi:hypothetical protein